MEILELDPDDVAVGVLGDEDQVDHADRPGFDELLQRRRDLAAELVPGELHEQELYRPEIGHLFPSFGADWRALSAGRGHSMAQVGGYGAIWTARVQGSRRCESVCSSVT